MQCHASKACCSIRYLASVFSVVRCHAGAIQVEPISTRRLTRSIFMKRVLPITRPELRSTEQIPPTPGSVVRSCLVHKSMKVLRRLHGVGNPAKDIFQL